MQMKMLRIINRIYPVIDVSQRFAVRFINVFRFVFRLLSDINHFLIFRIFLSKLFGRDSSDLICLFARIFPAFKSAL